MVYNDMKITQHVYAVNCPHVFYEATVEHYDLGRMCYNTTAPAVLAAMNVRLEHQDNVIAAGWVVACLVA